MSENIRNACHLGRPVNFVLLVRSRLQHFTVAVLVGFATMLVIPCSGHAQEVAFTAIGEELYLVNLATGAMTFVGDTGVEIAALALAPSGSLFGVESPSDGLLVVEEATGEATVVGPLGIGISRYTDLSFDTQGRLWMLANQRLYRVDTTSGTATPQLDGNYLPGRGIAWVGSRLYTADDRLHLVDPATGEVETMGPLHSIVETVNLCANRENTFHSLSIMYVGPWEYYRVERIDPTTGTRQNIFDLPDRTLGLAVGGSRQEPGPALRGYSSSPR